jgi:hypothetical protein
VPQAGGLAALVSRIGAEFGGRCMRRSTAPPAQAANSMTILI